MNRTLSEELLLPVGEILQSPDNSKLYRPVTPDDVETIELADSLRVNGFLEAIVVTADRYIVSGHRRHCAARIAGLRHVRCHILLHIRRGDGDTGSDEFVKLLREFNRQRVKTRDELLREVIVDQDPEQAHRALSAYRKQKSKIRVEQIEVREGKRRKEISPAKAEFLAAIKRIINSLKEYWPLTLRQIHYALLNGDPPLIHASKPTSRYRNNVRSYQALIDLATRARVAGLVSMDVIDDPTRPVTVWNVHKNVAAYFKQEMRDVLNGYYRDLMQSQAIHAEVMVEKNTLKSLLSPVCAEYCIHLSVGRGQASTPTLRDLAKRYRASGKDRLAVIVVTDLDADCDCIAHSVVQRLRDEHDIANVLAVRAALTFEQVNKLRLPESWERAKKTSPNYRRYIEAHQTDFVWELEAVPPAKLQQILRRAIDGVIDRAAYNHEVSAEKLDAAHIAATREIVLRTLREVIDTGA